MTEISDHLRNPARLNALRRTGLIDSPAEEAFDRLTRLARKALGAPAAVITLVTGNRQFFKSCVGLPEPWQTWRQTPLSHSFCQHVIRNGEPLVVRDAREVDYLRENRAIAELGVVAYAGIPLRTPDGVVIGTVAALHTAPHPWTPGELDTLRDLAGCAASEVALREAGRHYRALAEQNQRLTREVEHRVGNNLAALGGLVSALEGRSRDVAAFAAAMRERLAGIAHVHHLLGEAGASGMELGRLVRSLLAASEATAPHRATITIHGPEVMLDARRVLPLAMVLVEWFSNSVKHGAHRAAGGRVEVTWEVAAPPAATSSAPPTVTLSWRERGGPRVDGPPAASLGTQLVEGFATRDLGGRVTMAYPAEGASHTIEFPPRGGAAEAGNGA